LIDPTKEEVSAAYARGCPECVAAGSAWRNLRMCLNCGSVGCCDSSPNRHASKHWQATGHNMMRSIEQGDEWTYDFVTGKLDEPEYRA
jgi:CPA1 family monovalent cation:H+ antiporter